MLTLEKIGKERAVLPRLLCHKMMMMFVPCNHPAVVRRKVWPIMFDDNIGRPDSSSGAHIVDVRDASTGRPVGFDTALRRHVVRAEPYLSIDQGEIGAARGVEVDHNFFLLEILKRIAPERAELYTADTSSAGSLPEP